jgi:DNA-binding NtrC family response regulator
MSEPLKKEFPIEPHYRINSSTASNEKNKTDDRCGLPPHGIRVLLADTDSTTIHLLEQHFQQQELFVTVVNNGLTALDLIQKEEFDVLVADLQLPRLGGLQLLSRVKSRASSPEVILISSQGGIEIAVEAMRLGASNFLCKPLRFDLLEEAIQRACDKRRQNQERNDQPKNMRPPQYLNVNSTHSLKMQEIALLVTKVARSNSTILITGESGVGKEVVARTIHKESMRYNNLFTDISCVAIPETLLESELFGYEKGSFTGADASKRGLFEVANGGTLFLDEVGEIGPVLQTKLLRVIETRSFYRVGGTKQISVDVRILAATNKDLKTAVEEGKFRKDLFYRLNTINIEIPPLRDHVEDIPFLVKQFINEFDETGQRRFSNDALEALKHHYWPGNIRELRNLVERVMLISPQMLIDIEDLPKEILFTEPQPAESGEAFHPMSASLMIMEKQHIAEVLQKTRWHRGRAAELLAISPKTLYRKIKQYDLDRTMGMSRTASP